MQTMKIFVIFLFSVSMCLYCPASFALSTPHHLYSMSRACVRVIGALPYALFVQGPKNIKETYRQEVWEQEKEKHRGKMKYKLAGIARAPGEEAKAVVDGVVFLVTDTGAFCKDFISIFFGD